MKPRSKSHGQSGLTLVEGLVVIAVVVVLAFLIIPGSPPRTKAYMVQCRSNLKQLGLEETIWALDHTAKFPAVVSTNQGGTMEYLVAGQVDLHFRTLKDYVSDPRPFYCPADSRAVAPDFATFGNSNISYFASLDAASSNQTLFFSGDRNLTFNGKSVSPGFATLTSNSMLGWSKELHYKSGWGKVGNLLFPDEHVEPANEERLSALTASMGPATNRLVFP